MNCVLLVKRPVTGVSKSSCETCTGRCARRACTREKRCVGEVRRDSASVSAEFESEAELGTEGEEEGGGG